MLCVSPQEKQKGKKGRLFHSNKNLPDMDAPCENPWRDLFLWAVLQNRQQMANYFWAMVRASPPTKNPEPKPMVQASPKTKSS